MYSKLILILLFIPLSFFAQKEKAPDTLVIKMTPIISKRVVLYAAKGAQQKYVTYVDSDSGEFKLAIPTNQKKGMYRLVFDQKTMNYVDFLYLKKGFEMKFDSAKPNESPVFTDSEANTNYYTNLNAIGEKQQKLDSLQVLYFQSDDLNTLDDLKKEYLKQQELLDTFITKFNSTENNQIVRDLIKANTRIQPKEPIRNPEEYLPFVKKHFFDSIDFSIENLIHSSILIDKLMDYVFYLTVSRDSEMQNKLYKEAVSNVLGIIENQELKSGFIRALIQSFAKEENISLTDFLFDNFYNKLDFDFQDATFRTDMQQDLKAAVGRIASDITWEEDDKIIKLSELKDYDNYIIVFWSTTCPHCLKEMPKFYDYIKDNKKTKVISIGIETEESQIAWKSETYYYPEFTHILGLGKWENPIARAYNVFSTPNYFILNTDKKIIAKPYELVDMKVFFKGLETAKSVELQLINKE